MLVAVAAALNPAAADDSVAAVTTPGKGVLTMCRSWIVHRSCKPYDKVVLPRRVAVGDRIKLTFGSNPKDYTFHVMQIRVAGDGCTILSHAGDSGEDGERLDVSPCQPTTRPATAAE